MIEYCGSQLEPAIKDSRTLNRIECILMLLLATLCILMLLLATLCII